MKECRSEGCKNQIENNYIFCIDCAEDRKKNKEKMVDVIKPGNVEDLLKNLNIAAWRLVNYKEHELIKAGHDPKKIRDEMWQKSQEDEKP
jgi:thermostable 8-oxoguanine DNA glycosylase